MQNLELMLAALVGLSLFLGFVTGYGWRGSKWRKARKARRRALHKAARSMAYGRQSAAR